jgi:hypothetical protein
VRAVFALAQAERGVARGRWIKVARMRIAEAGRQTLAERGSWHWHEAGGGVALPAEPFSATPRVRQ